MNNEYKQSSSHNYSPPKTITTIIKSTYEETIALLISQITSLTNDKQKNICLSITPSTFQIINYILNKQTRSQDEVIIIKTYLNSIPKFITFLNIKNPDQILFSLASVLKSEKYPRYYPIIKYGTQGDHFYIILKGKVGVLVPKESYYVIKIVNYIKHLIMLKLLNEEEIYYKTLSSNLNFDVGITVNDCIINTIIEAVRGKNYSCIEIYELNNKEISSIIEFTDYAVELVDSITNTKTNIRLLSPELYMKYTSPEFPELAVKEYINKRKYKKRRSSKRPSIFLKVNEPKQQQNEPENQKESKGFEKSKLLLSSYIQVVTQSQGDSFGELALLNKINKRTATIICEDECYFGIISRENFNSIIKEHQWKKRKNNVNFLLSFAIFKGMNWNYFESKIFNFFSFQTLTQGSTLINEGDQFERIYFVKEGQFELNISLTLNEIANIIHTKQQKLRLKPIEDVPKTKINFKLIIANDHDIIGFNDITFNDIYFSNVICISTNAKVYSINYDILSKISEKIPNFSEQLNAYVSKRENVLINRLVNLYNYHFVKQKKQDVIQIDTDNIVSMHGLFMKHNINKRKTNIMKHNQTQQNNNCIMLTNRIKIFDNKTKMIKKKLNLTNIQQQQPHNNNTEPPLINNNYSNKYILNTSINELNNSRYITNNNNNNNNISILKPIPSHKSISKGMVCKYSQCNIKQPQSNRPTSTMNDTLKNILGRKYRNHPTSKAIEIFSKTLRDSTYDDKKGKNSHKRLKINTRNKEAVVDLLYFDKNIVQDNPNFTYGNIHKYSLSRTRKRKKNKELNYMYPMLNVLNKTIYDSNVNDNILQRIQNGKKARMNKRKDMNGISNLNSFKSEEYSSIFQKNSVN